MTKASLRKRLRATLAALSPAERVAGSRAACRTLAALPEFIAAQTIMLYLALPDEIETAWLAEQAWSTGRRVAAPWVDWEHVSLRPVELRSLSAGVTLGPHGVRQPPSAPVIPLEELDLVVVPGLAFDPQGRRLGRGAGFYDRFLASPGLRAVRCGVGFAAQLVANVPHDARDQPLDVVVAAEQVFRPER